jgi:hypothetical protein
MAQHGGDWVLYEAKLRVIFQRDLVTSAPTLDGKPCYLSMPEADQFWHLISTGTSARTPDIPRCERLCWVRPMIEAVARGEANMWRAKKKNLKGKTKTRVHVALPNFSHFIVLTETARAMLLVTAYYTYSHQRLKLQRAWAADPNHLP